MHRRAQELPAALYPRRTGGPRARAGGGLGRGPLPAAAGEEPGVLSGASGGKQAGHRTADAEAAEHAAAAGGGRGRYGPRREAAAGAGLARRGAGGRAGVLPPVAAGAGRAVRGPAAGRLGLAEPAAGEAGHTGVSHRGEPEPVPHPRAGDGVLLRQRLHGAAGAAGL